MSNTPFNPQTGKYWEMGYPDMFKSFFVREQLSGDIVLCEDGKGNLVQVGLPHNMQQSVYEAYDTPEFSDGLTYIWGSVAETKNAAGKPISWQQSRTVLGESSSTVPFIEKITPAYRKGESILCIKISNEKDSNIQWLDINTAGRCWAKDSECFPYRESDPWAVIVDDHNAKVTVKNAGLTGIAGAWMEAPPLDVTAAGYVYGMLVETTPGMWTFSIHFTTNQADTEESIADIEAETVKVKAFEFELVPLTSTTNGIRIKRDWIHGGVYVDRSGSLSNEIPLVDSAIGLSGDSIGISRDDHQHPVNVDETLPLPIGPAGLAGTSEVYSRVDHVHKGVELADTVTPGMGSCGDLESGGFIGTSDKAARADHGHFIPLAFLFIPSPPRTLLPDVDVTGGEVGTSTEGACLDHQHPVNVTHDSNLVQSVGAANDAGTSSIYARVDHVHEGVELSDTVTPGSGSGSAIGTSDKAARADHSHFIPLPFLSIPPTSSRTLLPDVGSSGGEIGTSSEGARLDHQHPVNVTSNDSLVQSVGSANDAGTSSIYARVDHVHEGGGEGELESNLTPLIDYETGSPGSPAATTASKYNHRHPLNVTDDGNLVQSVGSANDAGTSSIYARVDHVHEGGGGLELPSSPSNPSPLTTYGNNNTGAAISTTWTAGGSNYLKIWRQRWRYVDTDGDEELQGIQHYEIYDKNTGGLIYVSAESVFTIHTPSEGVNPWEI
ncbi:MAG: hypothetical protein R6V06_00110 [Kiritimatiellia bacterium]